MFRCSLFSGFLQWYKNMCYKSSLNTGIDRKCATIGNIHYKDKNKNIQTENMNFKKVC